MGGYIEGSLIIDSDDSYEMKRSKLIKALTDSGWDQFLTRELVGMTLGQVQQAMFDYGIRRP
ncbi:MAG: hypothetical protein HN683_03295, partial [Gammaproteobacteria bacterium]|nr:hypothetical protein [Gammaproteobacteria bacterium]